MNKEVLKFSRKDAVDIVRGSRKDEFKIVSNDIYDTDRWSLRYVIVIERLSDGKFFKSFYQVGATELQDEGPYEYDNEAIFQQVFPVEKTIIVYE